MSSTEFEVEEVVIGEATRSPEKSAHHPKSARKPTSRRKRIVRPKQRGKYKGKKKNHPTLEFLVSNTDEPDDNTDEPGEPLSIVNIGQLGEQSTSTDNVGEVNLNIEGKLGFESIPIRHHSDSSSNGVEVLLGSDAAAMEHCYATQADLSVGKDGSSGSGAVVIEVPLSASMGIDKPNDKRSEPNLHENDSPSLPAIAEALNLLKDLLPEDWIVIADQKGLHFLLLSSSVTKVTQRQIFLKYDGSVEILVHCASLPSDNDIIKKFPEPAVFKDDKYDDFCSRGIQLCWEMTQFQACAGADFQPARSLWHDIPNTYVDLNPYHENVYSICCRSYKCQRLIPLRINSYRCSECSQVLKTLKERHKAAVSQGPKATTSNIHLSKEQAQAKLKEVQSKLRKSEKRRSYLEAKLARLETLLDKEGVNLDGGESKYFANILETSNLTEAQQIFLDQQYKYANAKDPRAHRWHPAIIRLAIKIRSESAAAYETLRDSGFVSLPHGRTIFDYTHHIKASVGVNKELLKMFVKKVEKEGNPENQYHALIFDEMYISQNLVYRRSDGALMGYVYMDEVDKELRKFDSFLDGKEAEEIPLATTILAFMVKGLTSNNKMVIASYPSKDLNRNMINARVWEVISQCEGAKIKILVLVCDGCGINRAFFKMLPPLHRTETGIVYDTPNIFSEDERPLFLLSDVAHLLKCIRNCLYNSRDGEDSKFRCLTINDQKLLWKTIVRLYYTYRGDTLRQCHKLNPQNIFPNSYSTMKVKYAAQVLSKTVANALRRENWDGTEELIKFIENIDRFFDMLNGAHSSQHIKQLKPDLAPYCSEDDPRFVWLLKDFWEDYILKWKKDNEERAKQSNQSATDLGKTLLSYQTIEGIEISIRGFIGATKWLLTNGNAKFVMARAFSQDPLERNFGLQRGAVGGSTNPNTARFLQTQINIAQQGELRTRRRKANVEDDPNPTEISSEPLPKRKRKK